MEAQPNITLPALIIIAVVAYILYDYGVQPMGKEYALPLFAVLITLAVYYQSKKPTPEQLILY